MTLDKIIQIEEFFDFQTTWTRIIYNLPRVRIDRHWGTYSLTPRFREYLKDLAAGECNNLLKKMILR